MAFQLTAVLILLAFYGCYFGKMILQKKKGIQTDQIGKGKTGFVKRIEVVMKIATFLVPAAEAVSIVWNVSYLPLWARIAGMLTVVCRRDFSVIFINNCLQFLRRGSLYGNIDCFTVIKLFNKNPR